MLSKWGIEKKKKKKKKTIHFIYTFKMGNEKR
jgi:hypothetical protein